MFTIHGLIASAAFRRGDIKTALKFTALTSAHPETPEWATNACEPRNIVRTNLTRDVAGL
jgi:hypothetical protein